jgi:hypothetical protein
MYIKNTFAIVLSKQRYLLFPHSISGILSFRSNPSVCAYVLFVVFLSHITFHLSFMHYGVL